MSVCAPPQEPPEPDLPEQSPTALPLEGNAKLLDHPLLNDKIRAYTLTRDIQSSATRGKFVSKLDVSSSLFPSQAKILELLRPEDPCKDALEAIVRPMQRRGLVRPYDDDTKRFLEKSLLPPSSTGLSQTGKPESESRLFGTKEKSVSEPKQKIAGNDSKKVRSLADELREAEEDERSGANIRRELLREFRRRGGGIREAMERDRLGKLALSVEDDEVSEDSRLSAAARRLDALLVESRSLHEELAGIHEDMQAQCARAYRCSATARALTAESRALRYLDDVVALLRGDVTAAHRTKSWPFAMGKRQPDRNYVV